MSWSKNFFTNGNYDRLQNEEREFNKLSKSFPFFQDSYVELGQTHLNALQFLKNEREEVIKNISFAKTVFAKVKSKVNSKKQEIKNDSVEITKHENVEFSLGDISIDFQGKLDNVSETFVKSLDSSFKRLENKKKYTKGDVQSELAMVAVETLISGVTALIGLNSEVNKKRRMITEATSEIKNATQKMTEKAPKIYAETKRIIEIATVLNKHNQVFSIKYQATQKELNKGSKIKVFFNELFNKQIVPNQTMQANLQSLRMFTSEYSRFNKDANI